MKTKINDIAYTAQLPPYLNISNAFNVKHLKPYFPIETRGQASFMKGSMMQPLYILRPASQPTPPLPLGLTTSHPLQAKQPATLSDLLGQLAAPLF